MTVLEAFRWNCLARFFLVALELLHSTPCLRTTQQAAMSNTGSDKKTALLEPELREMKLEENASPVHGEGHAPDQVKVEDDESSELASAPSAIPPRLKSRSKSRSPAIKQDSEASSPGSSGEEVVGGDITLKMEPGKVPKLSRAASRKVPPRPPTLYLDLPDATAAAKETFTVLSECTYANKTIGTTDSALECDCSEEWGRSRRRASLRWHVRDVADPNRRCRLQSQQCVR